MAEKYAVGLLGVMDRLWFHHIILVPEHHSQCFPEAPKSTTTLDMSDSSSISTSQTTPLKPESEASSQETTPKERPTRLNLPGTKTRSHSSSPSVQKRPRRRGCSRSCSRPPVLQKTTSCKTLRELELEEVKGFMDLGFVFSKEQMSKRIMNLIPGLQRLKESDKSTDDETEDDEEVDDDDDDEEDDEDGDDEANRMIIRPYLSEAWLIRRPDSPLLNLRMPRASAAADMKKHLK